MLEPALGSPKYALLLGELLIGCQVRTVSVQKQKLLIMFPRNEKMIAMKN